MPPSLSQLSLAGAYLLAGYGLYIGTSQPNPAPSGPKKPRSDLLSQVTLTSKATLIGLITPYVLLGVHSSLLALHYPIVPPHILRYGATNGVNPTLVTWSSATAIPITLVLFVGVPLRLIAYSTLGKNFTFELAEPDRLNTGGIYRYIQHPSYTGLVTLCLSTLVLVARPDGPMACWVPPTIYGQFSWIHSRIVMPTIATLVVLAIAKRVHQEEEMLRNKFGRTWEAWNKATARFIPWLW